MNTTIVCETEGSMPPSQSIVSLEQLRKSHSVLLQRQAARTGTPKPEPHEISEFLKAASQLGRTLENHDERESAQAVMDYWSGTLLTLAPSMYEVERGRPIALLPFEKDIVLTVAGGAQGKRVETATAIEKADRLVGALANTAEPTSGFRVRQLPGSVVRFVLSAFRASPVSDDYFALRRLLLGFVRLKERSLEVYIAPLPATDDVLSDPRAVNWLQRLRDAGVLREQDPNMAGGAYALIDDSVVDEWKFLHDIVLQRRSFRQIVWGWNSGGKTSDSLLDGGDQLTLAQDYRDLSLLEQSFLDRSRRKDEKVKQKAIILVSIVAFSLVIAVLYFWNKNSELKAEGVRLSDQNSTLKNTGETLRKNNSMLQAQQKDLQKVIDQLQLDKNDFTLAITGLQSEQAGLQTANQVLTETIARQATQVGDLEKSLNILAGTYKELNGSYEKLREESNKLKEDILDLTRQKEELGKKIEDLSGKKARLEQQNAISQTAKSVIYSIKELSTQGSISGLKPEGLLNQVGALAQHYRVVDASKINFEIFVPLSRPATWKGVVAAVEELSKQRDGKRAFNFASGTPLPRRTAPTGATEIRYFHPEDADAAKIAKNVLKKHLKGEVVTSPITDSTAPKRWLQIAVSTEAFPPE